MTFCESLEQLVQQNTLHKRSDDSVLFLVLPGRLEIQSVCSETVCIRLVEYSFLFPKVNK